MTGNIDHKHLPLSPDLDVTLSSTGEVVKAVGEAFSPKTNIDASGDSKVSWKKVKAQLVSDGRVETLLIGKKLFAASGR